MLRALDLVYQASMNMEDLNRNGMCVTDLRIMNVEFQALRLLFLSVIFLHTRSKFSLIP